MMFSGIWFEDEYFTLDDTDTVQVGDQYKHTGARRSLGGEWQIVSKATIGENVGRLIASWYRAGLGDVAFRRRKPMSVDGVGVEDCLRCKRSKDCGCACWWCGA